jgi:hypothetical protein
MTNQESTPRKAFACYRLAWQFVAPGERFAALLEAWKATKYICRNDKGLGRSQALVSLMCMVDIKRRSRARIRSARDVGVPHRPARA